MKSVRLPLSAAVRRLLEVESRSAVGTSAERAALAKRLYEKLARHVSRAVGEAGLDALFTRSIKLTKPAFSCLRNLETTGPAQRVLSQFFEHLEKQEPAMIPTIIEALMLNFVSMLATFIGQGLTWQLLRNAWPELPREAPSEKTI
jgi:hypothetical protein